MKSKLVTFTLAAAVCLLATGVHAQRQLEQLGRGVIALRTNTTSVYVGWRLLGTDPDGIGFNLYRVPNGGAAVKLNSAAITNSCNYVDTGATLTQSNAWFVRPVTNGVEWPASAAFGLAANAAAQTFLAVPLQIPAAGVLHETNSYTYSANDCSAGDLDGDGEYEIIVKWDPSNAKDNSQSGFTGNVFLDAYKLNGTRLWRIDLGINIRAGAHYTQFMVYDLDGDGRAEVACKTAPGTVDGQGSAVIMGGDNPGADYRNSGGYILSGPEYLTVFDGLTGAALATTNYVPARGNLAEWGDTYGNRVDRFLACVAHLDGIRPSLVMCRGYYTGTGGAGRTVLAAWDWRDGVLSQRWVFSASPSANSTYLAQGNHNLSVGDVDGDGRDEIVYGSCAIDHNGAGLYSTGLGHGDAMHLSDLDPNRPGLEVWGIHEGDTTPGSALYDAATGEVIWLTPDADVGRGMAADLTASFPGYEVWGGTSGLRSIDERSAGGSPSSSNFAAWWDADLLRELEDGTSVTKYGGGTLLTATNCASNNSTKSNPGLVADLLGDWREEVVWRTSDSQHLRIYSTSIPATNRLYTLMHDAQYRLAVAWQNTAYNQPPHPGFFLGAGMAPQPRAIISGANLVWRGGSGGNAWDAGATANWLTNGLWIHNTNPAVFATGNRVLFDMTGSNQSPVILAGALQPGEVTVQSPTDWVFGGGSLAGTMRLFKAGSGTLTLDNTNSYSGATLVSGGTLLVNGKLTASAVTLQQAVWPARAGGRGVLGQGLTVQALCGVVPGGQDSAGTLTVSNHVTLLGRTLSTFDLSTDPTGLIRTNDRVQVTGNLVLSGTNTIAISQPDGYLGGGVYPLFTYSGSLSGGLTNLVLQGDFLQPVALTNPPGVIALVAVFPAAPPAAPGGLAAAITGPDQIQLTWTDNAADENSFLIERSTDNVIFIQIASVGLDVTEYLDAGLAAGTAYYYRVRAHNLAGNSGYSNTAGVAAPAAPGSLTATATGPFVINLSWADNSDDESAFLLERSPDNVNFAGIASVAANVTDYSDSGLAISTTYYYRVRAQNLVGESAYSAVASATTLAETLSLIWRGDGALNVWDAATTANWYDGASLITYSNGMSVTFDDSGSNTPAISLAGSLQPGSVAVKSTNDYSFSGAGGLVGGMRIVKSGASTLTLGTTNAFAGGIVVSNGTVALTGTAAGGYTANTYAPGSGAVTLRGGRLALYGYNLADNTSSFGAFTNDLIIEAGQTGTVLAGPRQTLGSKVAGSGTLNLFVDYLRGDVGGNWTVFDGVLNVLPTAGTPTSGTVDDFRVTTTSGFPAARLSVETNILMYSRAAAGSVIPIGEFAAAPGVVVSAGSGTSAGVQNAVTWRVGGADTDATNAARFQGTTSLIKEGAGIWTLTGSNTYSGATTVNAGTLRVNGNHANSISAFQVNGGALGGNGSIGGAVTVNSGGALAPGDGVGTLLLNSNLTLNAGAVLDFELGAVPPGGTSDQAVVGRALTLGGTLNVTGLAGFGAGTYTLMTYGGTLSGTLPAIGSKPAGFSCVVNTNTPGEVRLVVQPQAEPVIAAVVLTNGVLAFSGTGGLSGGDYYVLSSTNAALPLAQWPRLATNQFDGTGGFSFTDAVAPGVPQRYYLLQVP